MDCRVVSIACLVVLVSVLQGAAAADTLVVGDSLGWTVPQDSAAYQTWASKQDFETGDTIMFNWTSTPTTHDVAEVSKADYDSCNKNNPIGTIQQTSPVNITLDSNTTRYFICTVGTHCELGQKVTIGAGESSPSSASSLTVGAFSALLFTALVYFFI